MPGGTSPPFSSLTPLACLKGILWFPYSLYCMAGCAAAVAAIFLYRKLFSQDALTDSERNFDFSAKGTYGTSGWMQPREIPAVLNIVSDLSQHTGTVLGILDGRFLCIPEKTRMNGNLAVYGASGSMKTRSFCMNRILQSAVRGESLIICDPKSELYEKSSEYMRDLGYTVRVFNLVSPENSDSWNCLKEIEGQELMAQLFVDVIIKNTNGTGKSDRFWDSGEMNLLKALVLYVDLTYPPEQRNIGEVYNLITQCSESQLDSLFDVLPLTHPAKAPYSLYQRASDSVRSGVISGLGSRLQVFQSELIKKITAYDEISLELPGQQPCPASLKAGHLGLDPGKGPQPLPHVLGDGFGLRLQSTAQKLLLCDEPALDKQPVLHLSVPPHGGQGGVHLRQGAFGLRQAGALPLQQAGPVLPGGLRLPDLHTAQPLELPQQLFPAGCHGDHPEPLHLYNGHVSLSQPFRQ